MKRYELRIGCRGSCDVGYKEVFIWRALALAQPKHNAGTRQQQSEEQRQEITEAREYRRGVGGRRKHRVDHASLVQADLVDELAARIDQLKVQAKYMMQDQKKVGPNLKDVRVKLRKEWVPVWLDDPQKFRPGTKMPTMDLEPKDLHAVVTYLETLK